MLFGEVITVRSMVAPGVAMAVFVAFQLLTGTRVLRFKGRLHWRLHRWSAYVLAVLTVYHGVLGLALAFNWPLF
jgi:NhaP-type Na+/H+ or K+/H+ antiporter